MVHDGNGYLRANQDHEDAAEDGDPPAPNEYGCPFFYLHDQQKESDQLPFKATPFVRARIKINDKIKALQKALGIMNKKIIEELPADKHRL